MSVCVIRNRRCRFLDFLKKVEIVNDNFGLRQGLLECERTYSFALRLTEKQKSVSRFLDFLKKVEIVNDNFGLRQGLL